MRVSKWVDLGAEVEIDIDVRDIRGALAEAFESTEPKLDEVPTIQDILRAFNLIGTFLNAFEDSQIDRLTLGQRSTIASYLTKAAKRLENLWDRGVR